MNNDLISVIIPTYNREKLIAKSIDSVLNQSYSNIEVIVVDDGSTDNTKEIVNKISSKDKRVKYFSYKKNKGACYARNYGVGKANGTYIAFQDSDDIFDPKKLELQYENIQKNKSDFDFCKIRVNPNGIIIPSKTLDKKINESDIQNLLCHEGNFISTQAILCKKNVLKNIPFDEKIKRFQDFDLVLRVSGKYKISYTDNILVNLYRQKDSISNSDEKFRDSLIKFIKKDYSKYINPHNTESMYNCLLNLYINGYKDHQIKTITAEARKKGKYIIQLENRCNDFEIDSSKKESHIKYLENEITKLKQELNQVYNSRSWKITKPLRQIFKRNNK